MKFIIDSIISFFAWLGKKSLKIAKLAAQFSILVGINSSLIIAYIVYIGSILSFFYWIYQKIDEFLNYFNLPFSDELKIAFDVIQALGIWDGFVDSFEIISVGFVSLFVTYLLRLGLKALLQLRITVLSLIVASK